jgi:hypothetical protein
MRIETVVNDPRDLRCNRLLHNLPELHDKARAINSRPLETEIVGQGSALVSPIIERITRPTLTEDGRKAPALRFGDLRVQALAGATAAMLFTVTGITNRSFGLDPAEQGTSTSATPTPSTRPSIPATCCSAAAARWRTCSTG